MGAQGLCRVRFFWYNNRKAVIIPILCPTARRLRGSLLLMGNYTMPLTRTWYNNRRAVIIHLMAGAIRGRGPLPL